MKPPAERRFRLELGINLRSLPQVTTRWGDRFFAMENALVDVTKAARPAWFTHLQPEDRLGIRLVDISNLVEPRSPEASPTLIDFHFVEPDTGERASPFVDPPRSWVLEDLEPRFSPVFSRRRDQLLPSWDIVGLSPEARRIDLIFAPVRDPFQRFELSVVLHVDRGDYRDIFSFDPEMIVSDTGGGPVVYDD